MHDAFLIVQASGQVAACRRTHLPVPLTEPRRRWTTSQKPLVQSGILTVTHRITLTFGTRSLGRRLSTERQRINKQVPELSTLLNAEEVRFECSLQDRRTRKTRSKVAIWIFSGNIYYCVCVTLQIAQNDQWHAVVAAELALHRWQIADWIALIGHFAPTYERRCQASSCLDGSTDAAAAARSRDWDPTRQFSQARVDRSCRLYLAPAMPLQLRIHPDHAGDGRWFARCSSAGPAVTAW